MQKCCDHVVERRRPDILAAVSLRFLGKLRVADIATLAAPRRTQFGHTMRLVAHVGGFDQYAYLIEGMRVKDFRIVRGSRRLHRQSAVL